jgi:hypothetical protein
VKKVIAIVLVIGAGFWAKHRFFDASAAHVPSQTEVAAEKIGGAIASTQKVKQDERGLASMVSSLIHRGDSDKPEAKAKARMTAFMASWKDGGTSLNDAAQAAACYWSRGVKFIPDTNEIRDAADGFDRWRREKGLYTEIQSYEISDVLFRNTDPARGGDYSVVEVNVNGSVYRIGIPDKPNPLFWTN